MIFELAQDFHDAVAAMPPGHAKHSSLELLCDLLISRIQFLAKFPRAIIQEVANYMDDARDGAGDNAFMVVARNQLPHALLVEGRTATVRQVRGHYSGVCKLAVSPSGRHFLSGGNDGYVGYWERDAVSPLWLVSAHKGGVTFLAFSPDGRRAISTGDEGCVLLWDVDLGNYTPLYDEHFTASTMWPSASFCAFADDDAVVFVRGSTCRRIVINTGQEIWTNTKMFSGVGRHAETSCDFAMDKGLLAVGDNYMHVTLHDVGDGASGRTLAAPGPIEHVAVSAQGDRVLVADQQGHLAVFDCCTGREIGDRRFTKLRAVCRAHAGPAFFAYEQTGALHRIEARDDLRIESRKTPAFERLIEPGPLSMVCLDDNDTLVMGRSSGEMDACCWSAGTVTGNWPPGRVFMRGAIYPGGRSAIALVPQGNERAGHAKLGRGVAFVLPDGEVEELFNIPHGQALSGVTTLDEKRAVTVDRGGGIVMWRGRKFIQRATAKDFDFTTCTTWHDAGLAVAGTRDDQLVVLGVSGSWNVFSFPGTPFKDKSGIAALAVGGKPMSAMILYSSGMARMTGACEWRESAHMLLGTAAALAPGCRFAATGNVNGEVVLWHCGAKEPVSRMQLHTGEVTAMVFSSDRGVLYTAGADRAIYEIDPAGARLIWGTVLPSPAITLLADGIAGISAMDSGGNLYRFANKRLQPSSSPSRCSLWARLATCLRLGLGRFGRRTGEETKQRKEQHDVHAMQDVRKTDPGLGKEREGLPQVRECGGHGGDKSRAKGSRRVSFPAASESLV